MVNDITDLQVQIIYSKRKSVAIELRMDGILVRAPIGMQEREIYAFLKEKKSWIERHLVKMQEKLSFAAVSGILQVSKMA